MQPSVADLILVVTVKRSSFQVENRIYTNFYSMRETIITNTRRRKTEKEREKRREEKERREKVIIVSRLMYRYLQVISKDHCQNRSQNVFVPDDEADVEER